MSRVTAAGLARGTPQVFARNVLQIAVPRGNPGNVRGLADLARPDLVIALCAEQVPCGRAAARVLAAAGVEAKPDTFEQDATATITKVRLREVDAALVYRTDVRAARKDVTGIDFSEAVRAMNDYLIVAVKGGRADGARTFIDYVLSPAGQAALGGAGFRTP
jgi:molybdate transport system substrate-binding protein